MAEGADDTDSVDTAHERPPRTAPTDLLAVPPVPPRPPEPSAVATPQPSLTSAADALRDEEHQRTRLFIKMGWVISLATIGSVPMLHAPLAMSVVFVAALVIGIAVSAVYHHRFADPANYTEHALMQIAMMCVVNGHIAVAYYGAFTMAPVIVVIGIHFIARNESERVSRDLLVANAICYAMLAAVIIAGLIPDPGVFATSVPQARSTLAVGAAFVLGMYLLAYVSGRQFRIASLASIDKLQQATRLASQREALMDELRADLERALRIGGPGRYTEQTIGSFKLGIVIGRGAMGEVYEAVHTRTGEPAAVKLLRRELLADAMQVARFLREARAGGALASPHVCRVLEAGPDAHGLPYLAMERLRGVTLAELLRRDSRLGSTAVLEIMRGAGSGIDTAAAAGIVHRDLKPQNLFRSDPGRVWKILDFGVAALGDETGTLTRGGIVGTPSYMAPEQAKAGKVDGRADVYALAAIAYRCLTGRHAFTAPDTPSLLYAVVHRTPIRPSALCDLRGDVDDVLAIALAKEPAERFATGAALAAALAAAFEGALEPALRRRAELLVARYPWEVPS